MPGIPIANTTVAAPYYAETVSFYSIQVPIQRLKFTTGAVRRRHNSKFKTRKLLI